MELNVLSIMFLLFLSIRKDVNADRTSLKIYEDIQSDIFCFRRLNATHQIGCASHSSGNVGVLYIVDDTEEIKNFSADFPSMPFVVAMPISIFNMKNMKMLKQSENIRGVVVFKPESQKEPLKYFSTDQACPNRNFGFYTEDHNEEYAVCKRIEWNRVGENQAIGMMYEDWEMPIFVVSNETHIESMRNCYINFNNGTKGWPLCSIEMKCVMLAAKDSETCMRRNQIVHLIASQSEMKTCDPLSDKNIVNTLFPTNKSEEITNGSLIVVSARLDAFSMFDKYAPGAHSTITGLVTLLTVAKNMADLRNNITEVLEKANPDTKQNILFIIFNGEAFDYIGSSRVVFDMQKNEFPSPLLDGISDQPALMNLSHVSHFIELSQLSPVDSALYLHTDPVSQKESEVKDEVEHIVKLLKDEARKVGTLKISSAPDDIPLPPASFQSFLRRDNSIPGVVIADHKEEFINRYYNSIFDSVDAVDVNQLKSILSKIASTVSGTLYQLVTGESLAEPVQTSEDLVAGLLECYLQNASCPLFRQIADPKMIKRLRVEPYPLYVSVDSGATKANAITLYTRYLLAYLTGIEEPDRDRQNCTSDIQNQIYQYDWMAGGSEVNESGICIKSTVMYTLAQSPAFALGDWKSTEYSTWTESVWQETSARIFLQPGKTFEGLTLFAGIVIFLLSIGSVYFVNERSSIIFNTKPLVGC